MQQKVKREMNCGCGPVRLCGQLWLDRWDVQKDGTLRAGGWLNKGHLWSDMRSTQSRQGHSRSVTWEEVVHACFN